MRGLTLFLCCCAFVQVQSLAPYVFSDISHYRLASTNADPAGGGDLATSTFKVRFNRRLFGVVGWDAPDNDFVFDGITTKVTVLNGENLVAYGLQVVALGNTLTSEGFDFRLRVLGNTLTTVPSESTVTIVAMPGYFCGAVGACELSDVSTNDQASPPYTVMVGSTFTWNLSWNSQAPNTLSAVFEFNHYAFDRTQSLQNLFFTIDGVLAPTEDQIFIAVTEKSWLLNVEGAIPSSVICLTVEESGGIIGDKYGNSVDKGELDAADLCHTMPAVELCGEWSEWSDCPIDRGRCDPIAADEKYNMISRTRKSDQYPNCPVAPETKVCPTKDKPKCFVNIRSGETGFECDANNCGSTAKTASGCRCGGNFALCQSYFKNCLPEEESSEPKYFYLYAPCWQTATCTLNSPAVGPPPSFACSAVGFQETTGTCNGRTYQNSCACTLTDETEYTCGDFSGTDVCCGGKLDKEASCLVVM